jgi:heptosyltransferase-2
MPELRKSKLLVIELWGLGDLVLAIPFLQASSQRFEVTLIAKPYGQPLGSQFFPLVKVIAFVAPWTAFRRKYRLFSWPWGEIFRLRNRVVQGAFDLGLSARWDPREHLLLRFLGIRKRFGFPRQGSMMLLTDSLTRPGPEAHRYEYWRTAGRALNLDLPPREKMRMAIRQPGDIVVVHTGAGHKVRVWPLDRYRNLVAKLRRENYGVTVLCDADQHAWWQSAGEKEVAAPQTIEELSAALRQAGAFVGNDSGPGHLAAHIGVPTFTLFGSAVPEWFAPLHPAAEWLPGRPCPYRPCGDYCRFPTPNCLWDLDEQLVWSRVEKFVSRHIRKHSDFSPSASTPSAF